MPHWGGHGLAAASLSVNFISAAAAAGDYRRGLQSRRRAIPVTGTRRVSKRHMLYNQANPHIAIDPHTADIRINGQALHPCRQRTYRSIAGTFCCDMSWCLRQQTVCDGAWPLQTEFGHILGRLLWDSRVVV